MSDREKRLEQIRSLMREHQIDAWIVYGSDPHGSEYVAPRWRTRAWLSGFTGSAGTVVVTETQALLWVDSRYFIQAAQQIAGTSFELMKLDTPQVPDHVTWLVEHMQHDARVGVAGEQVVISAARTLRNACSRKQIELVFTEDWFSDVWVDRPPVPCEPVRAQDLSIAGVSAEAKVERVRKVLKEKGCTHTLISSLDDIAWLLNVRGSDVAYNPVFLAYLFIHERSAVLFADSTRFDSELTADLSQVCEIRPYTEVYSYLGSAFSGTDVLYLSIDKTNVQIQSSIPVGVHIVEGTDISTELKARKSLVEIEGMRRAHVLDGVAMVKLLAELDRTETTYSEITIAERLEELRAEHEEFLGPSFSPIAGFNAHGALAHYSATEETSAVLEGDGLLVLDTGGQYRTGTTDITRTLLFGEPTEQMRRDYTLVLKGNLALAAQRFPAGTFGYQLDTLARQYLWQAGLAYGHGTGHGVGFCLNVHEGPQNISPKPITAPLDIGVILSDEPGIYREGLYGIRLENLVVVQHAGTSEFGIFHAFDVLTLCPFERRLIETDLLTETEKSMLDAYHGWVYQELSERLSKEDAEWLRAATLPL
ncbi:MAG TPA: aminopeptidase P family protein [Sphaerochaetaceae bacterium]|jgi:Xaa-Pro aminopeptidase|nr:aminopeptidase P family protein [Sphaerochaetaceae bacterium]